MVDLAAVIGRVKGMFKEPEATLAAHADPAPPWTIALREHALPVVAGCAAISSVVLLLILGFSGVQGGPGLDLVVIQFLLRVVLNLMTIFLFAAVVMVFSGMFGGASDFNSSYVLVALGLTPMFVAELVAPIPALGIAAAFGGLIYSMIILYRGVSIVLRVPQQNRAKHFALTLATLLFLGMILVMAAAPFLLGGVPG
ncbi:YIP1 family protein [Inquilinus sp. CAU 1745]|uniref:YIP1 family protein n=1 Tax=Inquilinus sp. CAU 1745 TaxID=3140369 RepID=UPI00325BC5B3